MNIKPRYTGPKINENGGPIKSFRISALTKIHLKQMKFVDSMKSVFVGFYCLSRYYFVIVIEILDIICIAVQLINHSRFNTGSNFIPSFSFIKARLYSFFECSIAFL